MSRKFSIFEVYDYRGGELSSRVNLNEDSFYGELAELFNNSAEFEENMTVEEIETAIKTALDDEDFYYAGGDGFCGEIYEHKGSNLTKVQIEDFIPEIAKYVKENYF